MPFDEKYGGEPFANPDSGTISGSFRQGGGDRAFEEEDAIGSRHLLSQPSPSDAQRRVRG